MKALLAVVIALAAAALLNLAIYLEKRAVDKLPQVKMHMSWALIKAFLSNKPWMTAQIVNVSGFALYTVALDMAPVSVVEPLIASGVVLLAYLAMKHLGEKPRRIDLFAMGLSGLGVALLGVSLAEGLPGDSLHDPLLIWVFAAVVIILAILVPLGLRGKKAREAAGLGVSVGLFFGIAAVFQRLLLMQLGHNWWQFGVFLVACICSYIPAFVILQAALQRGMAVIVAPVYNGLMEFVPIVVGMVALNERFPSSVILTVIRILAFALILAGTIMLAGRAEAAVEEIEEREEEGLPVHHASLSDEAVGGS